MIGIVLDMLQMDEWYSMSNEIEIAKGKNELATNFKTAWRKNKRKRKCKL